jgi:hypothetical protein
MADKNLEIQVKLTADTAGAQQAAAEIKRLADEANKKPFVMPIDEAGMKAREEAMKLQVKAAKEEATAQEQVAKQTQKATAAKSEQVRVMAMTTTTANGTAAAQKQLTDKTTQSAMGFLQLSQAVEDAQYGFRGIVNNIPGMVMSFGGGAGLAGAVSLAAVGINVLLENVDLFGTKAKKAQQDAADLTQEMMKKSETAYLDARATEAAAKAQEAYNAVLQQAEGHYKAVLAQAEAVTRQKKEMADAEIASADADAALQVAQLQLAETRGEVSKEDAIRAREKIRTESEARKFTAETAAEEAKIAETRKKAAAEEELANNKAKAAQDLKQGWALKLFSRSTQGEFEAERDVIKAGMEASRLKQEQLAKSGANSVGLKQEQDKFAEMQERLLDTERALRRNKQLQNETGFANLEEAQAALKKLEDEIGASRGSASQMRQDAAFGESALYNKGAVFQTRQAAAATTAQAQMEQIRQAERGGYSAGFVGPLPPLGGIKRSDRATVQAGVRGLAEDLRGDIPREGFLALQRAAEGISGGDKQQLKELSRLLNLLAKKQVGQDEEIRSLLAQVKDLAVAK